MDRIDSIFRQTQILAKQANSTEKNLKEACANIDARHTPKAEHAEEINSIANNFKAINACLETLNDEFYISHAHVIQGVINSAASDFTVGPTAHLRHEHTGA